MSDRFPGVRKFKRTGDIIDIEFFGGEGSCGCPMIRDGYQEAKSGWCRCGDYWYKTMLEAVTGQPVEVETTSSCIRNGSPTCKRRAYLKASSKQAKKKRK